MQFKHPEILYFLFLLLIPIIVHLFQLRRFEKVPFTNVQFLKNVITQTRKSSQLKKWLTLITRMLIFVAIIFAFAQPYFSEIKGLNVKTETVVYLDNSFSMQAKGSKGELLKRSVQEILNALDDADEITLFTNDNTFINNGTSDLGVVNWFGDNVGVLHGTGDGTFSEVVDYPAGFEPYSIAIGDLNGDSVSDLAVTEYRGSSESNVNVLIGDADGSFDNFNSFPVGPDPISVAIGDLDGDDVPDLLVANETSDDVSVLIGFGDGTFANEVRVYVGGNPYSVAIEDLDGDSMLDFVVARIASNNVHVLLNQCDSCPEDLDGSSEVNATDMFMVLDAWGECDGACTEDINGDGFVGFTDLLLLLAAWGPC